VGAAPARPSHSSEAMNNPRSQVKKTKKRCYEATNLVPRMFKVYVSGCDVDDTFIIPGIPRVVFSLDKTKKLFVQHLEKVKDIHFFK
jgi:hypothetical protein